MKNQVAPVSDGSLPQVCFVGSGNKMLVSTYCCVIVRIFEILVVSPCSVSFENQAAAAFSRFITLVGLLFLLSNDQVSFVLEFCAAVALCRILTLEEGVAVHARFGFVCGCLELAAAGVFMVRASTFSMGHFSCLLVGISRFSFVFEEGWFLIAAEAVTAWSSLESYFAAAVLLGFIYLENELAVMMLLPVPEAAAAWSCPEFPFSVAAISETLSLVRKLAVFVIGVTWSMSTTTLSKGSSCAATAAASPRVDVEKTPHAAAAAASKYLLVLSGHVWTEFRGLPCLDEKFQRVGGGERKVWWWDAEKTGLFRLCCDFGSSVQVRVEGSDSYESLAAKIVAKVNIPECHWYLTFLDKDL